jgi:anti-anti-sigma factor
MAGPFDDPFDSRRHGDVLVVSARVTKLDSMEAEALLEVVYGDDAAEVEKIVVDLRGVTYASSGTMSVLFRVSRSHRLRLCALDHGIEKLLHVMGFLHLIDCDRTLDDALAALAAPP